MIENLLRIGDEVELKVDRDTRQHTSIYAGVPDGTKGVVSGFYDAVLYYGRTRVIHLPGVYHHRGAASVWLPDGRIITPHSSCIKMVDTEEEKRREAAMRNANGVLRVEKVRLGDLPPTPFWEEDKVRVRIPGAPHIEEMVIDHIDYSFMHRRRGDKSPWPFYNVRFTRGDFTTGAEEAWIELVERGPVWKHYHNEPITFRDVEQEAHFFESLGHTEEVRNPANGLYAWTKEEVLEAILSGLVHGFSLSSGFFGSGPMISASRFKNEDLGRRVAQATLQGFGVAV